MDSHIFDLTPPKAALSAPQSADLFASPTHSQAIAMVVGAVRAGAACCLLTGAGGLGKTTVLHAAAAALAADADAWALLKIRHPAPPPLELQRLISAPLGLGELVPGAPEELARRLAAGTQRRVVLLVDDAQHLPLATLLYLRLLSDLLHRQQPVLQVVLAGQPALLEHLRHPHLAGRFVESARHAQVVPLPADEMHGFLAFRLAAMGRDLASTCTGAELAGLIAQTEGVPGRAEQMVPRLLSAGSGWRHAPMPREPERRRRSPLWLAAGGAVALGAAAAAGLLLGRNRDRGIEPAAPPAFAARQDPGEIRSLPRPPASVAPPPAPVPAAPMGAAATDAEIARLLQSADAQIAANPLLAAANANVAATFQQMMNLIGQASAAGRRLVMDMDAHFLEEANIAEQAGRPEEAQRFRFYAGAGGAAPVLAPSAATPPLPDTPVRVSLLYDASHPRDRDLADRLADALRGEGVQVTGSAAASRPDGAPMVRYFFVEDRDGAADVARRLTELTGLPAGVALARRHPLPLPGAVEALLP